MTVIPFDELPPPQTEAAMRPNRFDGSTRDGVNQERAVAELIRQKVLSHTFGHDGEFEVRTKIAPGRPWEYHSSVLWRGKVMKREFFPITGYRTPQMKQLRRGPGGSEANRLSFAQEVVDVHFSRCAALEEYVKLAAIYDQLPSESRRPYTLLVLLIGAVLLAAYGVWTYTLWTDGGQLTRSPTPTTQGVPSSAVDQAPAAGPTSPPRPGINGASSRDVASEEAGTPRGTHPAEGPKTARLTDLLGLEEPLEKADARRASTPRIPPGATPSDVQAGDLLLLTGWIHRISRSADSSYQLQLSPSRKAGTPGLTAVVPLPDHASSSPVERAKLQSVRTFIMRQLLRQQEPSAQGTVLNRPALVQLTGQLVDGEASGGGPSRRQGPKETKTRWEMRPVVDIRFAPASASSDRSATGR